MEKNWNVLFFFIFYKDKKKDNTLPYILTGVGKIDSHFILGLPGQTYRHCVLETVFGDCFGGFRCVLVNWMDEIKIW